MTTFLASEPPTGQEETFNELGWLYETGLVFEAPRVSETPALYENASIRFYIQKFRELHKEINLFKDSADYKRRSPEMFCEMMERFVECAILQARIDAINLRFNQGMDAYAWSSVVYEGIQFDFSETVTGELDNVLRVILTKFPIPDKQTSWEHILEFRSDPESRRKFLAIKNWMRDVSKLKLPANEIEEKVEFLMAEYEHHMHIHKMKTKRFSLESLIVTPLEVLEDVVKIKWSKVGKRLFSIKTEKIALMEAEASSPGREVAFIVAANERFG